LLSEAELGVFVSQLENEDCFRNIDEEGAAGAAEGTSFSILNVVENMHLVN